MSVRRNILFLLLCCGWLGGQSVLLGQGAAERVFKHLRGHWSGAFIKSNAQQPVGMQFYATDGKRYCLQTMPEWFPQYGEFELPIAIDSTGELTVNTGYGKAILTLDTNYLELVGYIEGQVPAVSLHLKKVPPPPAPNYRVDAVSIDSDGLSLSGHLHHPLRQPVKTALIYLGGRGCYAGSTEFNLFAKVLRQYGVAVLVFDKRGTGGSAGDCASATISDLAADVAAARDFLAAHPNAYEQIGVIGSSAGGWVMTKAAERTDFDFMIGIVGPATSVADQQRQSMAYGADFYELSPRAKSRVAEYTELMLSAPATATNFDRMQELLATASEEGWRDLLDDTDIAASATAMDSLWVRRHAFDPGLVLASYDGPLLMIYGETDWIVPYQENIARLRQLFTGPRAELLTTVVAYQAEHGTETAGKYVTLTGGKSYWHFYRIAPRVLIEIVDFLQSNGWIE